MALVLDGSAGVTFPSGSGTQAAQSKVLQVVTNTDTTNRSTTSNTPVASGFSASITPIFSTSKILVIFNGFVYANQGTNANIIGVGSIYRGSSTQLTASRWGYSPSVSGGDWNGSCVMSYLDSPATTSSTTYNFYWSRYSSTYDATVGMNSGTGAFGNGNSTFILMEIAA